MAMLFFCVLIFSSTVLLFFGVYALLEPDPGEAVSNTEHGIDHGEVDWQQLKRRSQR